VLAFLADPKSLPTLAEKFDAILRVAQDRWEQGGNPRPDDAHVRELAHAILEQLAEQQPTYLDVLKAQVDLRLAYRYLTPQLVEQTRRQLLGGLLSDSEGGPELAHAYDAAWLDATAGTSLRPTGVFDLRPTDACDQAVYEACAMLTAGRFDKRKFVPRSTLADELQRFLRSAQTVFVLVGNGGVGKTWAVAEWMMSTLAGRARLLIPGVELDLEQQRELPTLVAGRLRPYSTASQTDDELLLRLMAAAREESQGSLVLALDDLQPIADVEVYRRSLQRLVEQCRTRGVKLVLTCQTQVWQLYRLERAIPPRDRYKAQVAPFSRIVVSPETSPAINENATPEKKLPASNGSAKASTPDALEETPQRDGNAQRVVATGQSGLPYTLALGDFTPDEQQQVLASRLSTQVIERAALALRTAPFLFLRRPYLLDLYLLQHGSRLSAPLPQAIPVDVDTLVDSHINELLMRAADVATIDEETVHSAFDALVAALWSARPNGVALGQAEGCLVPLLGGHSQGMLDAMCRVGLLTLHGQLRFAETQIAERVFARYLLTRQAAGDDLTTELRPEPDAGVAVALLRALPTEMAVPFAEQLLHRDDRWRASVASGLAQVSVPDTRVLAMLTILTRPQENVIGFDGCDALGVLAARDACALKWVTAMYVGAHALDRYRGARALAATFEYAPERVEAAVRLRLAGAGHIDVSSSSGREERAEWLRESLTPLLNMRHTQAAAVARRLLVRCTALILDDKVRIKNQKNQAFWRFQRDMDEIRGQVALFDTDAMESLQADVLSPDAETRVRAAVALRNAMLDEPERVQDIICAAIARECDSGVLVHLLWATSRLSETCPDQLLDALANGAALDWATLSSAAGQVLATLSNLAMSRPERVAEVLPQQLNVYPAPSRAWLTEGLAYAWWVCAERIPGAHEYLKRFATPELTDVPEEFQIFLWRAAALAQLGLLCLDGAISTNELRGLQILYPNTRMQFCFVDTAEFVRSHARALIAAPELPQFIDSLRRCEQEFDRVPTNPLQRPLVSARSICANQCFEMLLTLAIAHPDPVPLVSEAGADWHTFEAARRLLEAGRTEPSIREYARTLCAAPITGRSVQSLGERERCLQQLADRNNTPQEIVQEMRADLRNLPFAANDRAAGVARLLEERPDDLLEILDTAIESEHDLSTLYFLAQHAHSWPTLLLARVYARMFEPRPLTIHEAQSLCTDALLSLAALPDSTEREAGLRVYSTISSWLDGKPKDLLPTTTSSLPSGPFQRSLASATTLMHDAFVRLPDQLGAPVLLNTLASLRGAAWWEADDMRLRGDTVSIGSGSVLYVFPAIRLALYALTPSAGRSDVAATFLAERAQVQQMLSQYSYELDPRMPYAEGYLEEYVGNALDVLSDPGLPQARDERLFVAQSTLLRRLGRLDEAVEILKRGLDVFAPYKAIRARLLYDLGCAYALLGRESDCREVLQSAGQLDPFTGLRYQWLFEDPELAAVRDIPWLKELGRSS